MAPYEVELKVRVDHATVRPRLDAEGFQPVGRCIQVDRYLQAPHRDLAVTDEAVRLRTVEDLQSGATSAFLTYKGPRAETDAHAKSRTERTCEVTDADRCLGMLRALDFSVAGQVEKHRERFERGEVTVTLDEVRGAGSFVEIERLVDSIDRQAAEAALDSVVADLSLDDVPHEDRTYLDLVQDNA